MRNTAAQALASSRLAGVDEALFELADAEHLPAALAAIVTRDSERAMPILVRALEDDFARDAAMDALHRCGAAARESLVSSAHDRGNGSETSLRRRRAAVELMGQIEIDRASWDKLEPLLDESDAHLVCETAHVGASTWGDPLRIAGRLIQILPDVGWEWLSTVEDLIVDCAIRTKEPHRLLMALTPDRLLRPDVMLTWRRISRRIAAAREYARDRNL